MKNIVASVGLVALGASGLQAASMSEFTAPSTKPWSVSATLRGFYDDNINSFPDTPGVNAALADRGDKRYSWGFEVSPAVVLNWALSQTQVSLGFVYSYLYYENKPFGNTGHDDQNYTFTASLQHDFSERYHLALQDSFVIGQEPDMLRAGNAFATFQRVPGDNIRNYGAINFDGKATRLFGYQVGYDNSFYDYHNTGGTVDNPSLAGLLNRIENRAHIDTRWQLLPETVGIVGYQFRQIGYTADEPIGAAGAVTLVSKDRDSRSHQIYAGVDQTFRTDLTGSLRAGGQFTDYYNDPFGSDDTVSPYVQASLRWTYLPESFFEVGFTFDRNATDLVGATDTGFTTDAESAVVWANLRHRIMPKLFGSVQGQFQDSKYHGGSFNDTTERFYLVGVNLEYQFNRYFAANVGYDYDKLDSDAGRSFDRNRFYFGVTASY